MRTVVTRRHDKGDRVKLVMSGKFLPYKYYGASGNHQKLGYRED